MKHFRIGRRYSRIVSGDNLQIPPQPPHRLSAILAQLPVVQVNQRDLVFAKLYLNIDSRHH